jgi:hypothetical protein
MGTALVEACVSDEYRGDRGGCKRCAPEMRERPLCPRTAHDPRRLRRYAACDAQLRGAIEHRCIGVSERAELEFQVTIQH